MGGEVTDFARAAPNSRLLPAAGKSLFFPQAPGAWVQLAYQRSVQALASLTLSLYNLYGLLYCLEPQLPRL